MTIAFEVRFGTIKRMMADAMLLTRNLKGTRTEMAPFAFAYNMLSVINIKAAMAIQKRGPLYQSLFTFPCSLHRPVLFVMDHDLCSRHVRPLSD
jgi:hypothetical protein